MKILHYTLGFPPERTGGLVKYSLDLINNQIEQGHEIVMLYPGRINLLRKNPYFKFGKRQNINYAELINSLPLPLIGNVKKPQDFMKHAKIDMFIDFLETVKPDVIHIHTLMGIYSEFMEAAKSLNIKIVFTTHDYFGISPHPKMYLDGHDFVDDKEYDLWNNIRPYGSNTIKLRISQLSMYPKLRKLAKNIKNSSVSSDDTSERKNWSEKRDDDFQELKNYYFNMLKYIDVIHFNSSVSKSVYEKLLPNMDWKTATLPVSSQNVEVTGEINLNSHPVESIAYIGPYTKEKGFFEFLKFANDFIVKGSNNKAFIMGDSGSVNVSGINNLGPYDKKSLIKNLELVDLVILPSRWHETFGLIALEVLSTGTKVVVTTNMGVSDVLPEYMKINNIKEINIERISEYNFNVDILSMEKHEEKIIEIYNDIRIIENM
ncbi:glycosyltransferase [Weissella koreensis]|uniref:glycosyltransferase n=1 Tax=Weissella koreensis TaxID=165096 RepID=UPI0022BA179C|nr:glycosyltransferase [Weissella koreensis]MCZ9310877.1 glycosyltransferase [Weissella koreensis]